MMQECTKWGLQAIYGSCPKNRINLYNNIVHPNSCNWELKVIRVVRSYQGGHPSFQSELYCPQ